MLSTLRVYTIMLQGGANHAYVHIERDFQSIDYGKSYESLHNATHLVLVSE